jgi:hypothetical protein
MIIDNKQILYESGLENYIYKKLGFSTTETQRRIAILEYYNIPLFFKENTIKNFTFYSIFLTNFKCGDDIIQLMKKMENHLIYIDNKIYPTEIIKCLTPFAFINESNNMRYIHGFKTGDEVSYREELNTLFEKIKPSHHFSFDILVFIMDIVKLRSLKIKEILND